MYTPSLPYRRLVKFANGIWDENRKTFYPFKSVHKTVSTDLVSAKKNIHIFVKSSWISAYNSGDKAASNSYITATCGVVEYLLV